MTEAGQGAPMLIRGGRIYDHDGDVHQPSTGDLLVSAGRIERIAPRIDAPAGAEVIDASNKLVVPGFINAHYHSHDVLMKGLFEEVPFDIWTSYTGAAGYGTRSHREVRIRTLIGFGLLVFTRLSAALVIGVWFLLQFIPGLVSIHNVGGVAYFAHIGGFLFGLLAIKLFAHRAKDDYIEPRLPVY